MDKKSDTAAIISLSCVNPFSYNSHWFLYRRVVHAASESSHDQTPFNQMPQWSVLQESVIRHNKFLLKKPELWSSGTVAVLPGMEVCWRRVCGGRPSAIGRWEGEGERRQDLWGDRPDPDGRPPAAGS